MFHQFGIMIDDEIINVNIWSVNDKDYFKDIQDKMLKYPLPFDMIKKDINSKITIQVLMMISLRAYIQNLLIVFCELYKLNGMYFQCSNIGYVRIVIQRLVG